MKELIVIISNGGYADELMEVAKTKGAFGGTIIHGRGSASKDVEHFLGITIQPEKDLILMIVDMEIRNQIMQEVSAKLGVGTKAHAICFSIPVDATVGIKDQVYEGEKADNQENE